MKKITYILIILILFTSCLTPKGKPVAEKEIITAVETIPEVEPIVEKIVDPEVFVVTVAEYDKTFDEIEIFIADLNKIISSRNFVEWQTHLVKSYIDKYGDKLFLQKLSDNPVLKDYGIKLKKLRDYFNYVVVPSRSNVVIDEIQFITEDKIKAFTFTNNEKFVVYLLIRNEDGWVISD